MAGMKRKEITNAYPPAPIAQPAEFGAALPLDTLRIECRGDQGHVPVAV
jgi:hypothetical protein